MSLDAIALQAVTDECAMLNGSKIVAIEQYGPTEIGFVLRGQSGRHALAVSVQPNYGRIYLTDTGRKSEASSAFLNVLREYLIAGTMDSIETLPNERVLIMKCSGRSAMGVKPYRIVIELIDRHTMMVLMNELDLTIIETLRRVRTGDRDPSPGEQYEAPDSPVKVPLTEVKPEHISEVYEAEDMKSFIRGLTKRISGLSPSIAREIVIDAQLTAYEDLSLADRQARFWPAFEALTGRVSAGTWTPCIGMDEEGAPVIISAVPIASLPAEQVIRFDTMNEAIETYYTRRLEQEKRKQREALIGKTLTEEVKRLERLTVNLWQDVSVSEQENEFRKYGELLTANISNLRYGQSEAIVRDYYDPEQSMIQIALNPERSPADNADRYFKRARKARDGRALIEQRLLEAEERLEKVRRVKELVVENMAQDTMEKVYRACVRLELIKDKQIERQKRGKKQKGLEIHPRRFVATDGSLVLVGRNNKENEVLTKTASPDDIWLHARDIGGSHVILKREGKKAMPSKQTCYEAACVAAYFSKGRGSTTVPVDYTERRYVRKQKNGGPGQVIFTHEKTLFVGPELILKEADDKDSG